MLQAHVLCVLFALPVMPTPNPASYAIAFLVVSPVYYRAQWLRLVAGNSGFLLEFSWPC